MEVEPPVAANTLSLSASTLPSFLTTISLTTKSAVGSLEVNVNVEEEAFVVTPELTQSAVIFIAGFVLLTLKDAPLVGVETTSFPAESVPVVKVTTPVPVPEGIVYV